MDRVYKSHFVLKFTGKTTRDTDISEEPFCVEISKKNAGPQFRGQHFARANAIEMHMDISQEPLCVQIFKENAGRSGYHLAQHRASTVTVRTPSVWPHCLGKHVPNHQPDNHSY